MEPLTRAIKLIGLQPLASGCGVTYQAVRKWGAQGMPRSEWSGETDYCTQIELMSKGEVTREQLLEATKEIRKARAASGAGQVQQGLLEQSTGTAP